jgi:hypothetical protein
MAETRKTVKDYLMSGGVNGIKFVDRHKHVYEILGIEDLRDPHYGNEWLGVGVKTTLKPNEDPDYPKFLHSVLSDLEATPEEVQRAKEGQLAQIAISLDPTEDPSVQNGGS